MEKINKLIKEKFPNAQFIIFDYEENNDFCDWSEIEKMGILVVKKRDPADEKIYDKRFPDGHPTADAWKVYTPLFLKKAGIN